MRFDIPPSCFRILHQAGRPASLRRTFYRRVFAPSIRRAREDGKAYEEIRDTIRKPWKPA